MSGHDVLRNLGEEDHLEGELLRETALSTLSLSRQHEVVEHHHVKLVEEVAPTRKKVSSRTKLVLTWPRRGSLWGRRACRG